MDTLPTRSGPLATTPDRRLHLLREIERKALWLSSWTIHHANHLRPKTDGLKVGGHQASSASLATILTALFCQVLRPEDRIAVKPHAAPVFHALRYLMGRETRDRLERFRGIGGVQSYPSRTKDGPDVDFSTGSVGLGVAQTLFASLVQDFVRAKGLHDPALPEGRMIALVGDAEFDEGNIVEAMLEGWKHDVRNLWWVIDYNRQSLDSVVSDNLFQRIIGVFAALDWRVVVVKWGRLLEAAFAEPGGEVLREWIETCPNDRYAALTFKGGAAWRAALEADLGGDPFIRSLVARYNDDDALARLMTNLGGHDMEAVLDAFADAASTSRPTCLLAYTIKGFGLPFAGHKDNHAGLMSPAQIEGLRTAMEIAPGREWERFEGLDAPPAEFEAFLHAAPWNRPGGRQREAPVVAVPDRLAAPNPGGKPMSTQEGFGRILYDIAGKGGPLADALVTTSPDVTVSTNLGPFVNRRGIFDRLQRADRFKDERVMSAQAWALGPKGQHIELGIAEHNLFLTLAALGLAAPCFGARLLPIGTVYDPFVKRGLDALTHALYQDARFISVATPSGITLAPEGGAHQSTDTTLIGMGLPNLAAYEPAFVDELALILAWALRQLQEPSGTSVHLRLSTRPLLQPARPVNAQEGGGPEAAAWEAGAIAGGYWRVPPASGAPLALAYVGAVAPEAGAAFEAIREDLPGAGLLAITSPDRLHAGWRRSPGSSAIDRLLAPLAQSAGIVTVLDGHPATLSWLGGVRGQAVAPLGVERFGQCGTIGELYALHGIDAEAILDAAARLLHAR